MLSRFCNNLGGSNCNVHYKNRQRTNCEECSELDSTSTAMMVFNNGYVVIIMDTSSMMDNTFIAQHPVHVVSNHDSQL